MADIVVGICISKIRSRFRFFVVVSSRAAVNEIVLALSSWLDLKFLWSKKGLRL